MYVPLTGYTLKIYIFYWAALSLSFRLISIRLFINIKAWGPQVNNICSKIESRPLSQLVQLGARIFDGCYIHLTMCFRAAAGALVSQVGGRALLQAKGLWLE